MDEPAKDEFEQLGDVGVEEEKQEEANEEQQLVQEEQPQPEPIKMVEHGENKEEEN